MTPATPAGAPGVMTVLGAVILAAVVLYFLFTAVDGMGLATQIDSAAVAGKQHRPAARTSTPQVINGRTVNVPTTTPELFLLELDLHGRRVRGAADRTLFEDVQTGDPVQVTYQQRRFTGALQVLAVSR